MHLPNRPATIWKPSGHHKAVVHEISVHSMESGVLSDVHLDEVPIMKKVPGWYICHVTAALDALQKVVELSSAFVEFTSLATNKFYLNVVDFDK